MDWWNGPVDPESLVFGIKAFWISRIGKLLQFSSGLVIILEIIGVEKIDRATSRVRELLAGVTLQRLSDGSVRVAFPTGYLFRVLLLAELPGRAGAFISLLYYLSTYLLGVYFMFAVTFADELDPASVLISVLYPLLFPFLIAFVAVYALTVFSLLALLPFIIFLNIFAKMARALLHRRTLSQAALLLSIYLFVIGFLIEFLVS